MIDRRKAMIVWENEFGDRTTAHDACGRMIYKSEYGNETTHGWEVDHIKPVSLGGTDAYGNLQPLHWSSNRQKADTPNAKRGQCVR